VGSRRQVVDDPNARIEEDCTEFWQFSEKTVLESETPAPMGARHGEVG
jgi:hypothetical protein